MTNPSFFISQDQHSETALSLILAWRDRAFILWGPSCAASRFAPLGQSGREWDAWLKTASILTHDLALSRDQAIEHIRVCLEICHARGDKLPPPASFFSTQKSWVFRSIRERDETIKSSSKTFGGLFVPDLEKWAKMKITWTKQMGEKTWKALSKVEPKSEHERWKKLLSRDKGALISVLQSGAMSPHFTAVSKSVKSLASKGLVFPESDTESREKRLVEIAEHPKLVKWLVDAFRDEIS